MSTWYFLFEVEKLSIYNLKHNLSKWGENLKEELEGIIFIKVNMMNESKILRFLKILVIEKKVKTKLKEIINKLEMIIIREIEKIDTIVSNIEKFSVVEVDENLFKSFELIRENYNKILLNIQKVIKFDLRFQMISSSTNLVQNKEKFNQTRLMSPKRESRKEASDNTNYEFLDKLFNEIHNNKKQEERMYSNKINSSQK